MSERTTVVLGADGRRAAQRLAKRWGVTPSEAIRRALLRAADEELGVVRERRRRQRVAAIDALGRTASTEVEAEVEAELRRLAEERDAW